MQENEIRDRARPRAALRRLIRARIVAFLCLSLILTTGSQAADQTGIQVPEMAGVDKQVSAFIEEWDIPGASVAIARRGRLVYARGFGYADVQAGEPVRPRHLFRIASVSKPFTAVAILKLVENGQLGLADKVFGPAGILNDAAYGEIGDPRTLNITVRHLLHHTAGWDRDLGGDPLFMPHHVAATMGVEPPPDSVTIIRYKLRDMLNFAPGTRFAYSNVGYCILGRVLEKITGQGYEEAVRTLVLDPLRTCGMRLGGNLLADRARGEVMYYDFPDAPLRPSFCADGTSVPAPYGFCDLEAMDASSGWIASATDLVRLLVAVDRFPTRPDILTSATLLQMLSTPAVNPSYAMGWSFDSFGYTWGHAGSLPGAATYFYKLRNGVAVALLFNSHPVEINFEVARSTLVENAIRSVSHWPEHDLFEGPKTAALGSETAMARSDVSGEVLPNTLVVSANFSNPFNPATTVAYDLPSAGFVSLRIYDLTGRLVRSLVHEPLPRGSHQWPWDGTDDYGRRVASGSYHARLVAHDRVVKQRMLLLK